MAARKLTPGSRLTPIPVTRRLRGVYFIQEGGSGPIKIGHAAGVDGVWTRFVSLQMGNPRPLRLLHVIEGAEKAHEDELHARFARLHMRGEWFAPAPILVRHIKDLRGWP